MKVSVVELYNILVNNDIVFFTGVPDSSLKDFCAYVEKVTPYEKHIIAANEGNAIAIAAGYYLGAGKLPLVYMQNSGIGNAANPLLSLCDPEIYSIPMLLMIGWRGEPGLNDAVQHIKDGRILFSLLQAMEIPYEILSSEDDHFEEKVRKCASRALNETRPVALIVKTGTFAKYPSSTPTSIVDSFTREDVIELLLRSFGDNTIFVSTTGRTSSELFEIRVRSKQTHSRDFLTVGSMGHCSSIALGIAIAKSDYRVVCIDGDGSLIMHMGSLTTIGKLKPSNFKHVLINNGVHESVGGQPTAITNVNIPNLAKATGYNNSYSAKNKKELEIILNKFVINEGPSLLEVHVKPGARLKLGRPTSNPIELKNTFMNHLNVRS